MRKGPSEPPDPSKGARIALVGLGRAAREIHIPACRAAGVDLVGGADPDPEARRAAARRVRDAPLYADAAHLLEETRPEWVIVATPPEQHRDLCLLALESGAHVFCEKPFVERLADAEAVVAAAARNRRSVAVNHEFRYMPIFEVARRAIGSPEFGSLLFVQAWEHLYQDPATTLGWRSSSRTLHEFGTHVVDLVLTFYGAAPERVFASMPRPSGSEAGDPIDVVVLEFGGGRVASIVLDRVCRGRHRYLEMRLDGEKASLRTSIGGRLGVSLSVTGGRRLPSLRVERALGGRAWLERGERRRLLARNPRNAFAEATRRNLSESIAAAASGRPPSCSASDARAVQEVVEAAYASARSGDAVRIEAPRRARASSS